MSAFAISSLTKQQIFMLKMLHSKPGKAVFTDDLHKNRKQVHVQIHRIRRALPPSMGTIRSIWGIGYMFVPAESGPQVDRDADRVGASMRSSAALRWRTERAV